VTAFVDTSALFALVDEDDENHQAAVASLRALRGIQLLTHSYVLVETLALLGRRLPWAATERMIDVFLPLIDVHPIDGALHRAASVTYREAGSAAVSFVDRASFAFMRTQAVSRAFAFDSDFEQNGFELVRPG
jgi:uncharacterized protein